MWDWISEAARLQAKGKEFAVVTVVKSSGSTPRDVGAKMIVGREGKFSGTIGGGQLEHLALKDALSVLLDNSKEPSLTVRYPLGAKAGQCCGGVVEILVEKVNTGPKLYLFGAGHVGQAVCRVLEGTAFRVSLVDERPEWLQSEEIPKSVVRLEEEWDEFVASANWNEDRVYVAVMTHRHDLDQKIIEAVVQKPARFIGLIGSRTKWDRFKRRLTDKGVSPELLARVKCPLGLPLGGKSPAEVALSLGAELISLHYQGSAPSARALRPLLHVTQPDEGSHKHFEVS
jgi:xanthine dehydrogenase accessory factor